MEKNQEILNIINQAIIETNSDKRVLIEQKINEIILKPDLTLPLLLNIYYNDQTNPSTKKYCGILIKKINHNNVNDTNIMNFCNFCFNVIFKPESIVEKKKEFLELLSIAMKNEIKNKKNFRIQKIFLEKIKEKTTKTNLAHQENPINILLMIDVLYRNFQDQDFVKMVNLTKHLLEGILKNFISKNLILLESDKFNLTKIKNDLIGKKCNELLTLIEEFVKLFKLMMKKLASINRLKKVILFRDLCENIIYIQEIQNIFLISIGNLAKNKSNILYNITNFNELNKKLNLIKNQSLKILIIFSNYEGINFEKNPLQIFKILGKIILESLYIFFKNPETSLDIKEQIELKGLLVTSLKYLIKTSKDFEYYEIFTNIKQKLIIDILLPNLITNKQEIENLVDNPEEFINATIEQLYHNCSTLKGKIGDLIENLCENIDGVLTYIVKITVELMRFLIERAGEDKIDTDFEVLKDLKDSRIFKQCNDIQKMDICLVTLTAIKSKVEKRPDLLNYLDYFLKKYVSFFYNSPILIQTRFIFFISDYLKFIPQPESYDEENKEVNKLKLELMIYLLNVSGGQGVVSFAALKNLDLFTKKEYHELNEKDFLEKLALPFLNIILQKVEVEDEVTGNIICLNIFIKENIDFFAQQPEIFEKIISVVVNRIKKEEELNNKHKNIKIVSLWKILLLVIEEKTFIPYFPVIDNNLGTLIPYLIKNKIKDWDTEFFTAYVNMIYYSEKLPNFADQLFDILLNILNSYKGALLLCYSVINSFLYYFPDFFTLEKINKLFRIFEIAITSALKQDEIPKKKNLSDVLLLLQISIQTIGTKFIQKHIDFIKSIYDKFSQSLKDQILDNFFFEKVEGIILSMFISIPEITWKLYSNNLPIILNNIINKSINFETHYEIKLLNLGLISIFKTLIDKAGKEYEIISELLNFLIPYMKFYQNHQNCETFYRRSKKMKLNSFQKKYFEIENMILRALPFSGENKWYELNEKNDKYEEFEDNYKIDSLIKTELASKIYSKIFFLDEYEFLGNLLVTLKTNNREFFENIKSFLNELTKKYIGEIAYNLRTVKVREGIFRIRKIVKIRDIN